MRDSSGIQRGEITNLTPASKQDLAHILWIGGAPDCGKSTVAESLAARLGISVYHFDNNDAAQIETIARTVPEVERFLKASLEERWIIPPPESMFEFLLLTFPLRFRLVIENLLQLPRQRPLIVEGYGLLPELLQPLLTHTHQAIWFIPTVDFKRRSMTRRGKPSFATSLSNPEKARENLLARDMLLAEYYRKQTSSLGCTLIEVDGALSAPQMTDLAEVHFARYLELISHQGG